MSGHQSAYPVPGDFWEAGDRGGRGLTKREWFAGMALQGLLAGAGTTSSAPIHRLCEFSVVAADDLLAELEKTR